MNSRLEKYHPHLIGNNEIQLLRLKCSRWEVAGNLMELEWRLQLIKVAYWFWRVDLRIMSRSHWLAPQISASIPSAHLLKSRLLLIITIRITVLVNLPLHLLRWNTKKKLNSQVYNNYIVAIIPHLFVRSNTPIKIKTFLKAIMWPFFRDHSFPNIALY